MDKFPILRTLLVGYRHSGKSDLCNRLANRKPSTEYTPTIGVDFKVRYSCKHKVKIQIWDLSGDPRFENIIISYMGNANCVLLVYDTTEWDSLYELQQLYNRNKQYIMKNDPVIFVVGTKIDKPRQKTIEEGQRFADKIGRRQILVSSKTGKGIQELVNEIIISERNILKTHLSDIEEDKDQNCDDDGWWADIKKNV